jgi:hypothetical protein
MNDEKKVSKFPGRRSEIARAVAGVIAKPDSPTIGGNQGDYKRPPCGTCFSWRRDQRAGVGGVPLNAGQCMYGPPTPCPILDDAGGMRGTLLVRPPCSSDSEGCDQHDDGTDDDDEGEPGSLAEAG